MDGIQTHMVGEGPVSWNFVPHPPSPEPTIASSLKGLGSTSFTGTKDISKGKMFATILVSASSAYAGIKSPKGESKSMYILSGASLFIGTLWAMS